MGRYDAHKHPFQYRMNQWAANKTNSALEKVAKSIPCHVVEVAEDFIKVAFETANGIFTPPIVKIPQSFSQFAREPTQKGNKGYAVPGHYYLGGITGDAGGNTNFYPRGNLTTISFQPTSHTWNPKRDYDQHTHMGGPNGWIVGSYNPQQQDLQQTNQQQQNGQQTATVAQNLQARSAQRSQRMSVQRSILAKSRGISVVSLSTPTVTPTDSTSSPSTTGNQQQTSQTNDQTQFSFDKNYKSTVQSTDSDHSMVVDKQNDHAHLSVTANGKCYLGGDGKKGQYALVCVHQGSGCSPCLNVYARVA